MLDPESGIEYGFIYRLTNTVNGKVYIGQTLYSVKRRWQGHCQVAGKNPKWRLSKAIVKYGAEVFKVEALAYIPGTWLNHVETACIDIYDSMRNGYNMRADGSRISPDVRKRMSEAHIGRPSNRKGKKNDPVQMEALRQSNIGRLASPETKAKMAASQRARRISSPESYKKSDEQKERARVTQTGKRMSAETLVRMSLAKLGKTKSEETKQRMKDAWKLRAPRKPITDEQRRNLSVAIQAAWDRRRAAKEIVQCQSV